MGLVNEVQLTTTHCFPTTTTTTTITVFHMFIIFCFVYFQNFINVVAQKKLFYKNDFFRFFPTYIKNYERL